eukprot:SAG22_NODE_11997_length_460_cov_1.127424_1_plen_123_part_01
MVVEYDFISAGISVCLRLVSFACLRTVRTAELPSEDPLHSGIYGREMISGMQTKDAAGHPKMLAYLKHYTICECKYMYYYCFWRLFLLAGQILLRHHRVFNKRGLATSIQIPASRTGCTRRPT